MPCARVATLWLVESVADLNMLCFVYYVVWYVMREGAWGERVEGKCEVDGDNVGGISNSERWDHSELKVLLYDGFWCAVDNAVFVEGLRKRADPKSNGQKPMICTLYA